MKNSTLLPKILAFIFFSASISISAQNTINSAIYGQNLWRYDFGLDDPSAELDSIIDEIISSGITTLRIGGIGANYRPLYFWDSLTFAITDAEKLIKIIKKYRLKGIHDIMIEVGYDPVVPYCPTSLLKGVSMQNAATLAANLVYLFNNPDSGVFKDDPITTWIIANEPDLDTACTPNEGGFGYNNFGSGHAKLIADYVKEFSVKMKNKSPDITIVAPDLTMFGTDDNWSVNKIMNALCGNPADSSSIMGTFQTTGGLTRYLVDQITIHSYPDFNTSDSLIKYASDTVYGFRGELQANTSSDRGVITMIKANTSRTSQNLKIGLSEYNIGESNGKHEVNKKTEVVQGLDYRSFLGGQWLALMLQEGMSNPWVSHMNFWAIRESGDDACKEGKGYISNCDSCLNKKRSTYHHFTMASHMKGRYYKGTFNSNTFATPSIDIKAFSAIQSAGFYIMIVNGNDSATPSYPFRINFDNSGTDSSGQIKFDFNLSSDTFFQTGGVNYYVSPDEKPLAPKSTVFLRFNCQGNFEDRKDYTEQDYLDDLGPQFIQIGNVVTDPAAMACSQPGGIGGTIVGNTTYANQTVIVNSDLLLASFSKLTFDNATVIMAPGTKITSTPMAALEIKNSRIVGCGNQKWEGIHLIGNNQNSEKLYIENSQIFHADRPVRAERISDIKIKNSVLANGETAIELDRSQNFEISENLIGGFKTGIKTTNTKKDFVSKIRENRIVDVINGIEFTDDIHNMLEIACNEIRFKERGIKSRDTELKEQGTVTESAGNKFINDLGQPENFIDHTGNPTKYFFGPGEATYFNYPNVMNIPKIQAGLDKACLQITATCGDWIDSPVSVKEVVTNNGKMKIFPNPTNGSFTVSLSDQINTETAITVLDIMGRVIISQKLKPGQQSIILSIIVPGLYLVTTENDGRRLTEKVILE